MRIVTPRHLVLCAGVLLVAAFVNSSWLIFEDPMWAVRAEASRLGHDVEHLETVSGGYRSSLLGQTAFGEFLEETEGELHRVYVEVKRITPLQPWRLATYRAEPAERD